VTDSGTSPELARQVQEDGAESPGFGDLTSDALDRGRVGRMHRPEAAAGRDRICGSRSKGRPYHCRRGTVRRMGCSGGRPGSPGNFRFASSAPGRMRTCFSCGMRALGTTRDIDRRGTVPDGLDSPRRQRGERRDRLTPAAREAARSALGGGRGRVVVREIQVVEGRFAAASGQVDRGLDPETSLTKASALRAARRGERIGRSRSHAALRSG
jgi:hypothetical protein